MFPIFRGNIMPDIFSELSKDADDLAENAASRARQAAAEREKLKVRLAEIEEIERTANHVPDRLRVLKDVYARRDQPVCPSCALDGRPPSIMHAVRAEDPDSFDAYKCGVCGQYTTVPLRDADLSGGGWVPY